jgi:glutamate racemase
MSNNAPIGVFDSGIGGLTVVKELMKVMPQEDIIYFGDTARTPYGCRPPAEILKFMHEILHFFTAQKVKMAVIACNTMTALGLDIAKKLYPFMLVGVNTGVKAALKASKRKNIGVIATQATIASGKHGKAIKAIDANATIYPQACPKFVPLIEKGLFEGAETESAFIEYMIPLREAKVESVILGCTHYPLIGDVISRVVGQNVVLVDPAYETAADAYNLLGKNSQLTDRKTRGQVRLCFSADLERVKNLADYIFADEQLKFELVNLQDFP